MAQANATVKVNGATVTSGNASADIALAVGDNVITTVVTAQDGTTTKTYTLIVTRAPAYTSTGAASYRPANPRELVNVTGYTTFRQVAWAGTFEGQTSMGLGVRARLPFRAFTIHDATGSRLVIDVAHRW